VKYSHKDRYKEMEQVRGRVLSRFIKRIPGLGIKRYCPVCGTLSKGFSEFGIVPRKNAKCVSCGALERHRLAWLYFERMTDLFDGRPKRMLHVAPDRALENLLKRRLGAGYLTADLRDPRAMVRMDVTEIAFAEETFDVICCSHVLEHVPDDRRAISELHRVLKSGGWAVLMVPITAHKTFEDPSIAESSERLRLFGQEDHVRRYGPDFVERLKEAGFKVRVITGSDFLTKEEMTYTGITDAAAKIYHCVKRLSARPDTPLGG